MSTSTSGTGHGRRSKAQTTSGWTAFDLKQRRKQQGLEEVAADSNPYPSLSQGLAAPKSSLLYKPFSSLLVPSIEDTNLQATTSSLHNAVTVDTGKACEKLKEVHSWADESLIQDILVGVNNNVHEALALLEAMVSADDEVDKINKQVQSTCNDFCAPDVSFYAKENVIRKLRSDSLGAMTEESSLQLLDAIKSLPIEPEPEWGEDDAYLIYRKDAIRMMRSASRHSKSANDAYIRGDRAAAHHFSLKAQEEWAATKRLNAKAAKEILKLRNCKNDQWTLDLHGLHAAEAVEALCEHLLSVESLVSPNLLVVRQGMLKESGMLVNASMQSSSQIEMKKFGRHHPTSRQRMALLQVITGKGNHSRGSAALPSAIRNFLSENRYHFDETRPGVIMVRPKFRLK